MLYYHKNIGKIYYGDRQIKEIWCGSKKVYGPTAYSLPQGNEYIPYGYYLDGFKLMTTEGKLVADNVLQAIGSEANGGVRGGKMTFILYLKEGKLFHVYAFGMYDELGIHTEISYNNLIDNGSGGWSDIHGLRTIREGSFEAFATKNRRACYISRHECYPTEDIVAKVSCWNFMSLYGFALTYDGRVLNFDHSTHEWGQCRSGAVNIIGRFYLNTAHEWRDIFTDEIFEMPEDI